MTDRKLMQQALEALDWHLERGAWGADIEGVAAALRERLTQPQSTHWEGCEEVHPECKKTRRREWVGLTDEEQTQVAWSCGAMSADWLEFAKAIEAKLKEKNT